MLDTAISMAWAGATAPAWCATAGGAGVDEDRLVQVFLNLLLNAAQAIEDGRAEKNEIRLRTHVVGERLVVEVRDTGVGIPPDALGRVFDPFFTTKPVGLGTGLGLSICSTIVNAMGGSVEVDSQDGGGSTFRVILPVHRESAAEREPPRRTSEAAHRARILRSTTSRSSSARCAGSSRRSTRWSA